MKMVAPYCQQLRRSLAKDGTYCFTVATLRHKWGPDLFVREALPDQIQHFALAPGQVCAQQSAGDFVRARELAQADVFESGIQAVDAGLAPDISSESGSTRFQVGRSLCRASSTINSDQAR